MSYPWVPIQVIHTHGYFFTQSLTWIPTELPHIVNSSRRAVSLELRLLSQTQYNILFTSPTLEFLHPAHWVQVSGVEFISEDSFAVRVQLQPTQPVHYVQCHTCHVSGHSHQPGKRVGWRQGLRQRLAAGGASCLGPGASSGSGILLPNILKINTMLGKPPKLVRNAGTASSLPTPRLAWVLIHPKITSALPLFVAAGPVPSTRDGFK
ncbi:hypothetical protein BD410DRAFT_800871 [Rickenella mellea]|uniref:Uncharacterized protein n=1 Tax=Rickenella mellea TaxID=50990 RepID=A0A4Y7QHM9_9AGAM|nr:hypothetical protein BD410DRAFT_800871 [Rickenella mellea]